MAARHRAMNALQGGVEFGAAGAGIGSLVAPGIGTAVGGAIGGAIGLFAGLLTPTESQELAERMARGEIDPKQQEIIADALKRRYHAMRVRHGSDLARRGLTDSTIAARLQGNLRAEEGDALADSLSRVSVQNRGMGLDMMSEQSNQRRQGFGAAASVLGNLYLADRQQKQQTGRETANRFGRLERANMTQPRSKPVLNRGGEGSMTSGNRRSMAIRTV